MLRMPKYLKREWAFFLGDCGRKKYNPLYTIDFVKVYPCGGLGVVAFVAHNSGADVLQHGQHGNRFMSNCSV